MCGRFLVACVAIACAVAGCKGTGSSPYMTPGASPPSPAPGKALVHFLRPRDGAYRYGVQIWDELECIGVASAGCGFAFSCDPGTHFFMAVLENRHACRAELLADRTYYVLVDTRMGVWRPRADLVPVTRGSELWDRVETIAREVVFTIPDAAKIAQWTEAHELEAAEIREAFEGLEGTGHIVLLPADAGR